ncbi:MAG: SCO family protein [Deltaproteobacteria bacterium]|nr:SCO family protein [Deltaproteobacteria bacterium]
MAYGGPPPDVSSGASEILREEQRPLYRDVPDVEVVLSGNRRVRLSTLWSDRPLLITMFYRRCAGSCGLFLSSLRSVVNDVGGLGDDYRIVTLSFEPADTVDSLVDYARALGIPDDGRWMFGMATPADTDRIAGAIGFWYRRQAATDQYDHPTLVAAVRRGKIVRVLLGSTVARSRFREVAAELHGRFIPFYARPGERTLFRCLRVSGATQDVRMDWGVLILFLPGGAAVTIAALVFRRGRETAP